MKRSASADRLAPATPCLPFTVVAAAGRQPRRLALRFRGCRLGLPVPNEMWGAAALAVRMAQPNLQSQLQRAASAAFAPGFSTSAQPPPVGPVSEDDPKALAEALAWRPRLSTAEEALAVLGPAAACAVVYTATAPATVQPLYAACMALLYAVLIAGARWLLLERHYKAVQRSERQLAGADSLFFHADSIHLHYKRRTPSSHRPGGGSTTGPGSTTADAPPAAAVHCLHGFGASCYSWSFVQQELADALHAVVTAHDMPGFGLTERPRSPKYYTLHFNGDAALQILDAEVANVQRAQQAARLQGRLTDFGPAARPSSQQQHDGPQSHPLPESASTASLASLGSVSGGSDAASVASTPQEPDVAAERPKRILIGHSMGGAAVAEGVISSPEGVAALVLVAPAIVALWFGPPDEQDRQEAAEGWSVVEEVLEAQDGPGAQVLRSWPSSPSSSSGDVSGSGGEASSNGEPLRRASSSSSTASSGGRRRAGWTLRLRRAAHAVAVVAKAALLISVRVALAAATPLLVVLLRGLVRSRRFWERGLMSAWHDGRRVTAEYVENYRSGQLVQGWEGGILRFLAARFNERAGLWGALREAARGEGHLTQAERLATVVRRHNIRVLIVHGASDLLVPVANSRRLAALLPGAQLAVFEQCGHMPQEECPERFVETVKNFVQSLDPPAKSGVNL